VLQDYAGALHAEGAFAGLSWADAKNIAAAVSLEVTYRGDGAAFLRNPGPQRARRRGWDGGRTVGVRRVRSTSPQRSSGCELSAAHWQPGYSDSVGFDLIATPTQKLDVSYRIRAAFRPRNDVIEFEIVRCLALNTTSVIALPDLSFHLLRDGGAHSGTTAWKEHPPIDLERGVNHCGGPFGVLHGVVAAERVRGRFQREIVDAEVNDVQYLAQCNLAAALKRTEPHLSVGDDRLSLIRPSA